MATLTGLRPMDHTPFVQQVSALWWADFDARTGGVLKPVRAAIVEYLRPQDELRDSVVDHEYLLIESDRSTGTEVIGPIVSPAGCWMT